MDVLGPVLKSEEKKRKSEKGTSSILRFFQSQESSSLPEHADLKIFQESGASSSGKTRQENSQQTITGRTSSSGSDAWIYKSDEIDPFVLNELSSESQAEVRAWTRPQRQTNTVKKRGSSIAHYFSPSANS